MPNDALPTYLQDHLAGALHAIELLKAMQDLFLENRWEHLQEKYLPRSKLTAKSLRG